MRTLNRHVYICVYIYIYIFLLLIFSSFFLASVLDSMDQYLLFGADVDDGSLAEI
jgi:hypothetical protein